MQTITLNVADNKITEKLLWVLERFKKDGVEISSVEDIEDLKLIYEAKKEGGVNIPLESALKEFGVGIPEIFAEVETKGFLKRSKSLKQNGSETNLTPSELSSATINGDTLLGLSRIKVVGFSENSQI